MHLDNMKTMSRCFHGPRLWSSPPQGFGCVVLGDLNCNPGWVARFPRAPLDISELCDQFVLDASLTRTEFTSVSPTWVGSQGWSNVLDYILLRIPIPLPSTYIHSSSPFPFDHFPVYPADENSDTRAFRTPTEKKAA